MITIHHKPYGSYVTRDIEHGSERLSALDAHYAMGYFPPEYPMPAIRTITQYTDIDQDSPFNNSLIIWRIGPDVCPDCGAPQWSMLCIWDYNFDRCVDFWYEPYVYHNAREVQEGVDKYILQLQSAGRA